MDCSREIKNESRKFENAFLVFVFIKQHKFNWIGTRLDYPGFRTTVRTKN